MARAPHLAALVLVDELVVGHRRAVAERRRPAEEHGVDGRMDLPRSRVTLTRSASRRVTRVQLVRGEGRSVSNQYGVRDAACPLSTRGMPQPRQGA